jgi:hypothetical protein
MDCPEWLTGLVENVSGCFETAGKIDWIWHEEEGEYNVKIFPAVMRIGDGQVGIDGDIRLDVGDVLSFFDDDPVIMWHLTGSENGAFHIEGTVKGVEVWLWFMENPPPPEIPVGIIDNDPDGKISQLN